MGCISFGKVRLAYGSGADEYEEVNAFTTCFERSELEFQYQFYQFELTEQVLLGEWGTLYVTTKVSSALLLVAFLEQMGAFMKFGTMGSIVRMFVTGFAFNHQFFAFQRTKLAANKQDTCKIFARSFVLLYAVIEMVAIYWNDAFPYFEGCPSDRYRCPFSFSSPIFAARGVVFTAIVIFHLTPSVPFFDVVKLITIMCAISRAFGFVLYPSQLLTSLWSTTCMSLQICIFLCCRYVQEIHSRRKFLLQLHIAHLRRSLRSLLHGMVPAAVADRVHAGEAVVEDRPDTIVLVCHLDDPLAAGDPLASFCALDRLHCAFDDAVRCSGLALSKVN